MHVGSTSGAPAGFKSVGAQPVGSGASLREMIRNIDNYFEMDKRPKMAQSIITESGS